MHKTPIASGDATPVKDDVSRRGKAAIAIFVFASLAAGLVYAGKQFASREIVLLANQVPSVAASRTLVTQTPAASAHPDATAGQPPAASGGSPGIPPVGRPESGK